MAPVSTQTLQCQILANSSVAWQRLTQGHNRKRQSSTDELLL